MLARYLSSFRVATEASSAAEHFQGVALIVGMLFTTGYLAGTCNSDVIEQPIASSFRL